MGKATNEMFIEWLMSDYEENAAELYNEYSLVNSNKIDDILVEASEVDENESPYLRTNLYSRVLKNILEQFDQEEEHSKLCTIVQPNGYYRWLATEFYMANECECTYVDFIKTINVEKINDILSIRTNIENPSEDVLGIAIKIKEKRECEYV